MVQKIIATGLLACLIAIGGCSEKTSTTHQSLYVFGTEVEIQIAEASPSAKRLAIEAIDQEFQRLHRDWHAWQPGMLDNLNQAIAGNRSFVATNEAISVIAKAQTLAQQSEGLFNPAIGRLIALWGFHADTRPSGPPPGDDRIQALVRRHPRMSDLVINGNTIKSRNRAVQLDFGGFVKGYAVERAMTLLREHGIHNAIVNAGGDLSTMGQNGTRPWRIGIRHWHGEGIAASMQTKGNEAVFTSGNYERFREYNDRRYAHIIDPRTGFPVDHIVSATVVHHDGAVADAAATALVVAGPRDWHRIARQMGIRYVMLVDANGTVYMNPEMARRIQFPPDSHFRIVISDPL